MKPLLLGILSGLLASSMGCRYGDYCPSAWGMRRTYAPSVQAPAANSGVGNQPPVAQVAMVPPPGQQQYQAQDLATESMELDDEATLGEGGAGSEDSDDDGYGQASQATLRPKVRRDPPTDYSSGPNKRVRH